MKTELVRLRFAASDLKRLDAAILPRYDNRSAFYREMMDRFTRKPATMRAALVEICKRPNAYELTRLARGDENLTMVAIMIEPRPLARFDLALNREFHTRQQFAEMLTIATLTDADATLRPPV